MRASPFFRQLIAVALVLSILTMRIGSVSHVNLVQPIQNFLTKTPTLKDDNLRTKLIFFKIKRALHDLTSLEETPGLPPHLPPVSRLRSERLFQTPPEVFLDIFRPPDENA
jgi:hypothetical protein